MPFTMFANNARYVSTHRGQALERGWKTVHCDKPSDLRLPTPAYHRQETMFASFQDWVVKLG